MLTVLVHASVKAFGESTSTALVTMRFVNEASTGAPRGACVPAVAAHGTFEETCAAVTREHAIVLAGRMITAYCTWYVVEDAT